MNEEEIATVLSEDVNSNSHPSEMPRRSVVTIAKVKRKDTVGNLLKECAVIRRVKGKKA